MKLVVLLAVLGYAIGGPYEGDKLYKVVPKNLEHINKLLSLEEHGYFLDFWEFSDRPNKDCIFMVRAKDAVDVKAILEGIGLKVEVLHDNVQRMVDADEALNKMLRAARPYKKGDKLTYDFAQYHRLDEIYGFLDDLVSDPNVAAIAEVSSIGNSFEERDMRVVRIGRPSENPKPGFWIDCNIHAREFITAGSCVFWINEMITQYLAGNPDYQAYVNDIDWFILPVANPDGYEFCHTDERYWRKNRSGPRFGFYGVDQNRNWDANFGGSGSSGLPFSDTYRGPSAFSEVENANMRDFIMARQATMEAFVTVHSFSQLWLIPYSYRRNYQPPDGAELNAVAAEAVAAIRATHGETYEPGTAANILYAVSGGSFDWAKETADIKWSYGTESRPEGGGINGFNPNPREIIPNAQEHWNAFRVIADRILASKKN